MTRYTGLCIALLCFAHTAAANVSLPRKPFQIDRALLERPAPKPATDGEFTLTARSEVFVDGKPCPYKDVPAGASVERIEVSEDGKTILRIEFRSAK